MAPLWCLYNALRVSRVRYPTSAPTSLARSRANWACSLKLVCTSCAVGEPSHQSCAACVPQFVVYLFPASYICEKASSFGGCGAQFLAAFNKGDLMRWLTLAVGNLGQTIGNGAPNDAPTTHSDMHDYTNGDRYNSTPLPRVFTKASSSQDHSASSSGSSTFS